MVRLLVATGELLDIVYGEQLAPIAMAALKTILAEGWRPEWDWSQLSGVEPDQNWRDTWAKIDGWQASSSIKMRGSKRGRCSLPIHVSSNFVLLMRQRPSGS